MPGILIKHRIQACQSSKLKSNRWQAFEKTDFMQPTWTVAELELISMDAILQILPPPKSKFFSFPTPFFHNNYLFKNLNIINNENRIKIKENNFIFS